MNEQEAIASAEAWYLRRYDAVAHGHITMDAAGHELREQQLVCLDLVPEQGTDMVNVVVDLTGAGELTLLDEGVPCPRCLRQKEPAREGVEFADAQVHLMRSTTATPQPIRSVTGATDGGGQPMRLVLLDRTVPCQGEAVAELSSSVCLETGAAPIVSASSRPPIWNGGRSWRKRL